MQIPYTYIENININQQAKDATEKQLDSQPAAIMLIPARPGKDVWDRLPYGEVIRTRFQRRLRSDKTCSRITLDLPNKNGTRVLLQTIKPDTSTFACLTLARKLAAELRTIDPQSVCLQVAGFDTETGERITENMLAALLTAACPMPDFKSKPAPDVALKRVNIYGLAKKINLEATARRNHGQSPRTLAGGITTE